MPTLVAVSAAPTKSASSRREPSARPATAPVAIGTTTPTMATRIEARPTVAARRRSISSPTSSSSRITPSSPSVRRTVVRFDEPEHRRPDDDAGDDLADDRRHVDAFGDLRGDLGRDEHDEDVEQDRVRRPSGAHPLHERFTAVATNGGDRGTPGPHACARWSMLRCAPGEPRTCAIGTKRPAPGCAWAPDRSMH